MSAPLLCLHCVFWNGMATEQEKRADGFFRQDGGRLALICRSHADAAEISMISFHAGNDEYLVQGVMEE